MEQGTPEPGPGEVLVHVLAAGLNRLDHYLREGSVTRGLKLPHACWATGADTPAPQLPCPACR